MRVRGVEEQQRRWLGKGGKRRGYKRRRWKQGGANLQSRKEVRCEIELIEKWGM